MPTAVPTMPHSLSGVSKQRRSPNSSCRPAVAPNTPPFLPTSSPNTTTRSSLRISVRSASLIASSIVITLTPGFCVSAFASVAVMSSSPGVCGGSRRSQRAVSQWKVADVGADAAAGHEVEQFLLLLLQLRREVHVDVFKHRAHGRRRVRLGLLHGGRERGLGA